MPKFVFELALFLRARLESLWLQMLLDWVIRQVREEYLEFKIIKHKRISAEIDSIIQHELKRRREAAGSTPGADKM